MCDESLITIKGESAEACIWLLRDIGIAIAIAIVIVIVKVKVKVLIRIRVK